MQRATGTIRQGNCGPLGVLLSVGIISVCVLIAPEAVAQPKTVHPLKQDESCLACHGQAGMTSAAGKSILIDPTKHAASVHGTLGCTDCHATIKDFPHPDKVVKVRCLTCHTEEASHVSSSIHSMLGDVACQSCHGDPHEVTVASQTAPAKCAQCHTDEVKEFRQSIHGQAAAAHDPDAPNCMSCHGLVHQIRASNDAASLVAKRHLPDTCATCHSNQQFLSRHKIPFAHPVELYKQSVHGRAIVDGDGSAATCSDCHGSHGIYPPKDVRSKTNHWNIPGTCGQCHADIAKIYGESVHGQAIKAGVSAAPVCSDCHGEHLILGPKEEGSLVNAGRVSMATCGRCHSDERLALRYNLPADRVPSYADSYHGLAQRGGSQSVANCASCHGVHNIFPSKDARSQVSKTGRPGAPEGNAESATSAASMSTNGKVEADPAKDRPKRLNPIKQKQMEDRCAFLEEEVPRVEAALATTEQQLGVYISAAETQRLTTLADELRAQLAALTAEWEDLMMQLEGA